MFKVACIQMCSGVEIEENLLASELLIRQAADQGVDLIVTPECTTLLQRDKEAFLKTIHSVYKAPEIRFYQELAKTLSVVLVVGSIPVLDPDQGKALNRCYVFGQDGSVLSFYDKIHLFDVDLSDTQSFRESDLFQPGRKPVSVKTPFCHLGLTICYDLRFPYLYRKLALEGVDCLLVPSAFTCITGRAHWETLLRARSIENSAYCFAPAQGGLHEDGRETWGHSLIVDPWGAILAESRDNSPDILYAEIDPEKVKQTRKILPSLQNGMTI